MPLQLAKPLANVPWRHSSETLERQQDSSPRHAKHKPEKLCERYLYQWQMSLGGTVPKHSNTSRIRAQGMQNTSQKNSPNVTFGIHKNNNSIAREMPLQLAKPLANAPWRHSSEHLNASRIPAQGMQNTSQKNSAGPRHAKHKPEKLCERYLYQWQMSLGGTVPKHSNTSRIRAQGMQNTSQKNSPNVTFRIHKKQQFYRP